jgi:hypothetical protein
LIGLIGTRAGGPADVNFSRWSRGIVTSTSAMDFIESLRIRRHAGFDPTRRDVERPIGADDRWCGAQPFPCDAKAVALQMPVAWP